MMRSHREGETIADSTQSAAERGDSKPARFSDAAGSVSGYGEQDFMHGDLDSTVEGPTPSDTTSGADTLNGGAGPDV